MPTKRRCNLQDIERVGEVWGMAPSYPLSTNGPDYPLLMSAEVARPFPFFPSLKPTFPYKAPVNSLISSFFVLP